MKMAQGCVAEAVKKVQRDCAYSPDAEVPLTVRADASAREGMRQHHRVDGPACLSALQILTDQAGGRPSHLKMAGRFNAQLLRDEAGFQPRDAVDGKHGI